MPSDIIILPTDSSPEQLRKVIKEKIALSKAIRDPRKELFETYISEGLDKETAFALSDLSSMDTMAQANTVLELASRSRPVTYDVTRTVVTEIPQSLQNIGATVGAGVGSAIGLGLIKQAVRHSASLVIVGITASGVGASVFAGKFVAAALGKVAAVTTAANILSATAFIILAVIRKRKIP